MAEFGNKSFAVQPGCTANLSFASAVCKNAFSLKTVEAV